MLTDQLNDWKTQAESAEILKCSEKTVGRMAAQKKIERPDSCTNASGRGYPHWSLA